MATQVRQAAAEECSRRLHETLIAHKGGRQGVVRTVLLRRAHRWSDDPEALAESVRRFSRFDLPTEYTASVLRTMLYAWCTSARFAQPVLACRLCACELGDAQQHYIARPVLRMWMGDRFGMRRHPEAGVATEWFLKQVSGPEPQALRAAVILDAALDAVECKRSGNRQHPVALLDARRRHRQVRLIPIGSWIPPGAA